MSLRHEMAAKWEGIVLGLVVFAALLAIALAFLVLKAWIYGQFIGTCP